MALLATAEYEARLVNRLNVAELAKSRLNTRIYRRRREVGDAADQLHQPAGGDRQVPPDRRGRADIPVTRLLGTSAKGLNATGEGDNDNYDEMVSARQETDLRPNLERLDAAC
jgi:hypothetical protein